MPNCPKCNVSVAPGSRFCPSCGSAINTATYCPGCGSQVAPGSAFCSKCGTRITPAPQAPQQPIYPQPAQQQPQDMATPVGGAPVAKTYGGLKVLKIILWVLAYTSMALLLYTLISYFVYYEDGYYSYYLDTYDWVYRDYLFRMYDGFSLSSYHSDIAIGFIITLLCSISFLIPAIIVSKVLKKMIRRQQETVQ